MSAGPASMSPSEHPAPVTSDVQGSGQEFVDASALADLVLDSVHDGICLIDPTDYRITRTNRAFLDAVGREANDVIGRHCFEVTHGLSRPCEAPTDYCPLRDTVKTGGVVSAEHVHRDKEGRKINVEVSTTPLRSKDGEIRSVIHVAHNITKLKQAEDDLRRSFDHLKAVLGGTVEAVALAVSIRDPYTGGHAQRVSQLASRLGEALGFESERLDGLRTAGLLHDLGKLGVPSEILSKPGKLSDLEMSLLKGHPQLGFDILKTIDFPWPVAEIVLEHHERVDGSGYPRGLSGEEILLEARILAVADVIEAMASHRPYRPALGIETAMREVLGKRGTHFDGQVVDAFMSVFAQGPVFG